MGLSRGEKKKTEKNIANFFFWNLGKTNEVIGRVESRNDRKYRGSGACMREKKIVTPCGTATPTRFVRWRGTHCAPRDEYAAYLSRCPSTRRRRPPPPLRGAPRSPRSVKANNNAIGRYWTRIYNTTVNLIYE